MSNKTNLTFCMQAQRHGVDAKDRGHPQQVMKALGISYEHATPQSMGDQWWFWNCTNLPDKLPCYLTVSNRDPLACVGYGIDWDTAKMLADSQSFEPVPPRGVSAAPVSATQLRDEAKILFLYSVATGGDRDGFYINHLGHTAEVWTELEAAGIIDGTPEEGWRKSDEFEAHMENRITSAVSRELEEWGLLEG